MLAMEEIHLIRTLITVILSLIGIIVILIGYQIKLYLDKKRSDEEAFKKQSELMNNKSDEIIKILGTNHGITKNNFERINKLLIEQFREIGTKNTETIEWINECNENVLLNCEKAEAYNNSLNNRLNKLDDNDTLLLKSLKDSYNGILTSNKELGGKSDILAKNIADSREKILSVNKELQSVLQEAIESNIELNVKDSKFMEEADKLVGNISKINGVFEDKINMIYMDFELMLDMLKALYMGDLVKDAESILRMKDASSK